MVDDCINSLSLTVKPKAFGVWEVEIHKLFFPSPIVVERAQDLFYVNLLKNRFKFEIVF